MNKKILKLVPRGFLKFYVLKTLKNGPLHGYKIMVSIKDGTGWKPTPGAIYPTLHSLKKQGLIKEIKIGRTISYELTAKGLELTNRFEESKDDMRKRFKNFIQVMSQVLEIEESELGRFTEELRKKYEDKFALLPDGIRNLLPGITDLIIDNAKDEKKHKKLKKILNEAKIELKKLKEIG